MNFIRTDIPDIIIIEPKVHGDERGYFVETFRADKLEEFLGYKINFCQDNEFKSSPTFGHHVAVELSAQNKRQMLVPRGFAHGFVVLEDDTIFAYKVDNYYSPENDREILFSDEALGIDWQVPHAELNLSAKDKVQPKLHKTNDLFEFGVNYYNA
ncbi:MAG: dTDP-4-dehydrorhamnose 3,5-epimerase [Planctomycetes bacterium]|nr:dTDP-4-dehydrorhamnose 3,5-epimerase [Planctomycetota bacterium]